MKTTLETTYIGQTSNIDEYARNARKFLIDNVHSITFSHDEEIKLLDTHDSMMHTPMSDLYKQASDEEKLSNIRLLILDKIDKVPSWFLISWLDIDTMTLRQSDKQSSDILNSISEYRDKILIDITSYYSNKKRVISDTSSFYGRIIRNLLCRSYHTSQRMWLSPNIIYLLAKFYAIILSTKIGKIYNLNYKEQMVAATALTVYFVNKCSDQTEVIDPMMGKMDFVRKNIDTKPIYEFIEERYTNESYDLEGVIQTILEFSPSRISNFTKSTFYSMNAHLTSNQMISLIALEYPPYWCYLILSALSGDKSNLFHSIRSLNLKSDAVSFQVDLLKSSSFIRSL